MDITHLAAYSLTAFSLLLFGIFLHWIWKHHFRKTLQDSKEALWATNLRADASEDLEKCLQKHRLRHRYPGYAQERRMREKILNAAEELWMMTHPYIKP